MVKHLLKLVSRPAALIMLTTFPFSQLSARDFTYEGLTYTVLSEDDLTVETKAGGILTAGNDVKGDIVIPANVSDGSKIYTVTQIGESSFLLCTQLTSITIPNTVTTIGIEAFRSTGLTELSIPASVTTIGYGISGSNLKAINVDSNNPNYQSIDGAFFDKGAKTLITFPQGKSADNYAIPSTVTTIGAYAFSQCKTLSKLVIPDNVTTITSNAFYRSSLTSIDLPNSVTTIEIGAFWGCENLKSITIPDHVTTIERSTFYECTGLTDITFGSSVTQIDNSAFYGCSSLENIIIPNSIKSINDFAFYDCSNLSNLTIGNSVTTLGQSTFKKCPLTKIDCLGTVPANVYSNADPFDDSCYETCELVVPAEGLAAYKAHPVWQKFLKITSDDASGIDDITIDSDSPVQVFDLNGIEVYSGLRGNMSLPTGMYIMVSGGKASKIAIR